MMGPASSSFPNIRDLLQEAVAIPIREQQNLSELGWWRIGGPADWVATPSTLSEICALRKIIHQLGLPSIVIGDGSNILFDDAGFRGVVIHISRALSRLSVLPDGTVDAQAGVWMPLFVRKVAQSGLSGCLHAAGIPGTVGGLVVMNGGSQRKGIGEHLLNVTLVEKDGSVSVLSKEECDFSYRHSSLQGRDCIVAEAKFLYEKGHSWPDLRKEILGILQERRKKFPKNFPNCGSVFLSSPELHALAGPPGRVIEDAGLKGLRRGGAQISPLHGNFIVNLGGATSADVLWLISKVRKEVKMKTGHSMECEVRHLLPDGIQRQAHQSADVIWPDPDNA